MDQTATKYVKLSRTAARTYSERVDELSRTGDDILKESNVVSGSYLKRTARVSVLND
jgi:hypothetical protein